MLQRLIRFWVYGGALAGVLLAGLTPVLGAEWPLWLVVTFLHLPAYMLHQLEEHDNHRFRQFVNREFGQGREILTASAVFLINVPGVWGVLALGFALAKTMNPGGALIAIDLVLLNGAIHLMQALVTRRYNPGLITAGGVFVPLGIFGLILVQQAGGGTPVYHALGAIIAVGVHAAILLHLRSRRSAANLEGESA